MADQKYTRTLTGGYYWVKHPTQGTIIIRVKDDLIFQIGTSDTRPSDDEHFLSMTRQRIDPPSFEYTDEHGWF